MSATVKRRRRYDATRRRAAAAATRLSILEVARRVFFEQGYVAATMPAIAKSAGVALDTVYASVGRKPVLFRELIEMAISMQNEAVPAEERGYVRAILAEPNPAQKIAIYAAAVAAIQERLGPLYGLVRDAAVAEPELARLWKEISERRAANMRRFADELARSGRLRVDVAEAADMIWATNSSEFIRLLVHDRGWSLERVQRWLTITWQRLLLD